MQATLANQGTRYAATFLQRVVSADYSELLLENEPEVVVSLKSLTRLCPPLSKA